MRSRDEFPRPTQRALALRAGHICSFPGCGQVTAGPSEEAPDAVTMIGVAAHISAAAPQGPRYDPEMTAEQRSNINNGIWLCRSHSVVIDRDARAYPVTRLQEMKSLHEANRSFDPNAPNSSVDDIIALGPNIIGVGSFSGAGSSGWNVHLKHFIQGDPAELFAYASDFEQTPRISRYVTVNELGDGRMLRQAPSIQRLSAGHFEILLPIETAFPRSPVASFGSTMAISPSTDDIFLGANGNIARVSGIEAFLVHASTLLGLAKGERLFHPHSGTNISRFYRDYAESPWLHRLLKSEIIRLASIPIEDRLSRSTHTPLRSVKRVRDISIGSTRLPRQRLPFEVVFELEGHGRWQGQLAVFVHTSDQLAEVSQREPLDWLAPSTGSL